MLLTLDRNLADVRKYPPGKHPGIVVFRPRMLGVESAYRMILEFAAAASLDELAGTLVVVEPERIRIRRV